MFKRTTTVSSKSSLLNFVQVTGGLTLIVMLPLVAQPQSTSFVFKHFELSEDSTGIDSKPYAVILSALYSHFTLYGYDTAAHLTEETKGADKNGPLAILSSIGIAIMFGLGYILSLTYSIKVTFDKF